MQERRDTGRGSVSVQAETALELSELCSATQKGTNAGTAHPWLTPPDATLTPNR